MESSTEDKLREMPIMSEEIGFGPADMLPCPQCERTNAPNRVKCMYCAAELPLSGAERLNAKADLRRPEIWENGFNIIYLPSGDDKPEPDLAAAAKHLGSSDEILSAIAASGKPFPAARMGSRADAELVLERLSAAGISAVLIADLELRPDEPPKRLRGVETDGEHIKFDLFNTAETVSADLSDVRLIVKGVLRTTKNETLEKRKKKEMSVVDSAESVSDDPAADIYLAGDRIGFRFSTRGFDFSMLGSEKGMLAAANMDRLLAKLRDLCPNAEFVDDYTEAAPLLDEIWELEHSKDSRGLQRSLLGGLGFSSVRSSSNLGQFTKYSRFRRYLNEKHETTNTADG